MECLSHSPLLHLDSVLGYQRQLARKAGPHPKCFSWLCMILKSVASDKKLVTEAQGIDSEAYLFQSLITCRLKTGSHLLNT